MIIEIILAIVIIILYLWIVNIDRRLWRVEHLINADKRYASKIKSERIMK